LPPLFGVSQKWLPRLLYKAQNTPRPAITSFSPAMTVKVDSCSTKLLVKMAYVQIIVLVSIQSQHQFDGRHRNPLGRRLAQREIEQAVIAKILVRFPNPPQMLIRPDDVLTILDAVQLTQGKLGTRIAQPETDVFVDGGVVPARSISSLPGTKCFSQSTEVTE
jgi:hypothetical protein